MVGTSAAVRVIETVPYADPRPGLFSTASTTRGSARGALSDGGNVHAWLLRTLRDVDTTEIAERPAGARPQIPHVPRRRALARLGRRSARDDRRADVRNNALDIAQAALEVLLPARGRPRRDRRLESVVATGGALLANEAWLQVLADVVGDRSRCRVRRGSAHGAAVIALGDSGSTPDAPIARIVEPRLDRHEIHLEVRRNDNGTQCARDQSRKRGGEMIGIVGGGLAAARSSRVSRAGGTDRIAIWSLDPHGPYHRPPFEAALARRGGAGRRARSPLDWYAEHDVDLRTGEG
jgi:gluconokinase